MYYAVSLLTSMCFEENMLDGFMYTMNTHVTPNDIELEIVRWQGSMRAIPSVQSFFALSIPSRCAF